MKNSNVIVLFLLLSIIFIFPKITYADSITNNNGIVISEQEYNDFKKVYDDNYIMNMSLEKYNKLKELNFDEITTTTKYVESMYNPNLQLTTEREITKEEYDNHNSISPLLDDGDAYYETQVKKISLAVIGGTTYSHVMTVATWKAIPATRSFDVIGVRGYGMEVREGSQMGEQIYVDANDNYTVIDYAWNGTNIKKFDEGYGISMNIVNPTITYLQLITECDVTPTIDHPTLYSSYQHAQQSLTLANSQNYTLGGAGLGDVFVYPYSIAQKYDGMSGVNISY